MNRTLSAITLALASTLAISSFHAHADDDGIERIEIHAERMPSELNAIARNVTVIDEDTLRQQFATAANLAEVLAKVVPGMAPPTPALTNFGTTLRGRNALVLIDGVPMNTNRNISRDLHNLHPSQVDRVEIFRGGNALFGSGATGGVIYIHTKTGQPQTAQQTTVGLKSSLTEIDGDGLSYLAGHTASGQVQGWLYRAAGSIEQTNGFYDADGDRLAPEPSQGDNYDSTIYSFDGKLSKEWDNQSLTLSMLWYALDQDSDYASDPSAAKDPYITKARAIKGLSLDKQNEINNLVLNAQYHRNLTADHSVNTQLYYRDYDARFAPFDGRKFATWNHLAQTYLESSNLGLRVTFNSKLNDKIELDWGIDASDERSEMPVTTFDSDIYNASQGLVFKSLGDKAFVPEISHKSLAAFVQSRAKISDAVALEAGVRYERIDASFKPFTTLGSQTAVTGSAYDYSSFVYNLGATYNLNDDHTFYIAANEGYELPDIGLQIRYANSQFDLSQSNLEPVETTDYELGWRGVIGPVSANLAYFTSSSDLGGVKSENMGLSLTRNKVRIDGFEASAKYLVHAAWALELNYSQVDGEEKAQGKTAYTVMNGFSIPPSKLSAVVNYDAGNGWTSQLTWLNVAGDDYRIDGKNAFARRDTQSYNVVDWQNSFELGQGTLTVGIENLLNKQYFSLYSQLQRNGNNTSSIPGRGRTLAVQYQFNW
ncbi:TonB-dependent receptor [Pseudoalteromonas fenneropenaei]|uniref:TonB-dependent receptor n=1 Tax=Pseudoalteromonas fenneropenaei TaxID=1737459 RepID=A0ABV7CJA3_9GAMM